MSQAGESYLICQRRQLRPGGASLKACPGSCPCSGQSRATPSSPATCSRVCSTSHSCFSRITREWVEGKRSACVRREANHKYYNIHEEKREEGRRMLTARMSASENLCSPAWLRVGGSCRVPGTAQSVCACVFICLCASSVPVGSVCWRGSVRPWVSMAHKPSPAVSGPPQLASQFSGRQMSPRCFSLPAWLRAVRVCVYFGQPAK